jgi:signal transduction histidine kinase
LRRGRVRSVAGVVRNLLANALRAAPAGSAVTVERRAVDDGVEVHVVDQGAGMDPVDRRRAFDRFWRAPDATDDGSGLGLAIVAELVRASGGGITLDAAPGTGIDAVVRLARVFSPQPPPRPFRALALPGVTRHRQARHAARR